MLDVISHLPAQPLFIAGIACTATFVVMKYGLGTVVQSLHALVERPIIKPIAMIASSLVGVYILSHFLSTPLSLMIGAVGALSAAVIKYGPGTVARSIGAVVLHPIVGVSAGIIVGIGLGFLGGLELVVYLHQQKPASFHELRAMFL